MLTTPILIFGGNSQIAQALRRLALPDGWQVKMTTRAACDFTRPGAIGKIMQDFRPELVINAAALTDIDACQRDPGQARLINFDAVATIAAQCVALDAPLIHISTDYVFDGADGARPYHPDDAMNPVNVYGESKMMGEEAVRHSLYWHVILRTSLVFGALGDNVLTKTLRRIDARQDIAAVTDQTANPTGAASLARALVVIAKAILAGKPHCFGTFHLCGQPPVTRYQFAQAIMQAYAPFTPHRPALTGVAAASLPDRVPRPACTSLDCAKTQTVFGIEPESWQDDLDAAVRHYVEQRTDK